MLTEDEAKEQFSQYIRRSICLWTGEFFSEAQMEDFSGVYYPCWIGDIDGQGTCDGEGHTVSKVTKGNWISTTTRYYQLHREGQLAFRDMVRKALVQADRQLSDGIHPYDLKSMKSFSAGYLSGFLAEKRDVEKADLESDMLQGPGVMCGRNDRPEALGSAVSPARSKRIHTLTSR